MVELHTLHAMRRTQMAMLVFLSSLLSFLALQPVTAAEGPALAESVLTVVPGGGHKRSVAQPGHGMGAL